ncbi:MAG: hypothetical protein ACYCX7_00075 [Solirubrobacteraceae bacterium]
MAEGRTHAEIARSLELAKSTVTYHARRLGTESTLAPAADTTGMRFRAFTTRATASGRVSDDSASTSRPGRPPSSGA